MFSFIISIIVVIAYVFLSWKRKEFYFFSPWFLPFAMFLLNYGFPVVIFQYIYSFPSIYSHDIYDKAILLQDVGIASFLLGLIFSFYSSLSKRKVIIDYYFSKEHPITIKFFLIIGICLLFIYGITSGVTTNLMQGSDVEDMRRKSEIGLGILKDPSIFFITFSILWLLCRNMVQKNKFSLLNAIVLIFIIILLFIFTGHKATSLWLVFLTIGVYNKFRQVSPFRIMILLLSLLVLVPMLNSIRQGRDVDFSSLSNNFIREKISLEVTAPYELNYVSIVKSISTGEWPLQYGKEYYQNALYFIPRFLWKEKPVSFDYTIKQKLKHKFTGGGVPPFNIASFYLNFSLIGVIIGMFAIGYLYQVFFTYYRNERNITKSVIFLMIIPKILNPSSVLSSLEVIVLLAMFVIIFDRFLKVISRYYPFLSLKEEGPRYP